MRREDPHDRRGIFFTVAFKHVWKKIAEKGTWKEYDWVLKLDADAVFVPWRLQKVLSTQPVSWTGIYVENCAGVQYGFFGNVEVLSHTAFETLLGKIDSCPRGWNVPRGEKEVGEKH